MLKNKLKIAIEGIDGSGKTTTAGILAKKLGGIYVATVLDKDKSGRSFFDSAERTVECRMLYYLSGLWETFRLYENETLPVIYDRYKNSTLIYHQILLERSGILNSQLINNFQRISPPDADVTFLLKTNLQIIENRLERRCCSLHYDRLENDHSFLKEVNKRYEKEDLIIIDTTYLTPLEVADICSDHITKMFSI